MMSGGKLYQRRCRRVRAALSKRSLLCWLARECRVFAVQECDSFCVLLQIRLHPLRPWHCVVIAAVRRSARLTVQIPSPTLPPPRHAQCFRSHFAKLGMRSLSAPAQPPAFKPGTVMTLQGMMNEALNGAYAKIESKEERKKGRAAAEPKIRVSLCGGHLHCKGVAKSLMKECVI